MFFLLDVVAEKRLRRHGAADFWSAEICAIREVGCGLDRERVRCVIGERHVAREGHPVVLDHLARLLGAREFRRGRNRQREAVGRPKSRLNCVFIKLVGVVAMSLPMLAPRLY